MCVAPEDGRLKAWCHQAADVDKRLWAESKAKNHATVATVRCHCKTFVEVLGVTGNSLSGYVQVSVVQCSLSLLGC